MSDDIISYRDLVVWQQAMDLVDLVYDLTERFPRREWYGLAAQMRKAAISEDGHKTFEALSESVGRLTHGLERALEARIDARH